MDDIHTILNIFFKAAVKHNLLQYNPLVMVFHTKHVQQHGSVLSKDEEKKLLTSTIGTPQQLMFTIELYTEMRPNEYATAKLEDEFIQAVNSKRKNSKIEDKQILVTSPLKPFLDGANKIEFLGNMLKRFTQKKPRLYA